MKVKYKSTMRYPDGKIKVHEDKLGSSTRFWSNQAKLNAKDGVKTSFATKTVKNKPVVTSVRSEFKDGTVMTTSLLDTTQLNKTVSRGKVSSHKKSSQSSTKKYKKKVKFGI